MGIRRLEISGYRSLADVVWEPGPLNLLIGANGSGKSNLLRALGLLRAAAEGKLAETIRREGGMVPVLWDGELRSIRLTLIADAVTEEQEAVSVSYRIELDQVGHTGSFAVGLERLVDRYRSHRNDEVEQQVFYRDENRLVAFVEDYERFGHEIELDILLPQAEALLSQTIGNYSAGRLKSRQQKAKPAYAGWRRVGGGRLRLK